MYRIDGIKNAVNINGLSPRQFRGAYMTHIHPDDVTHYSFSEFDVSEALENEFSELRGFDGKYEYSLKVLPQTLRKESSEIQHEYSTIY